MQNYKEIETRLRDTMPFRGNSLNGFWDAINGVYVVYSYSTLIASYKPSLCSSDVQYWVNPNKYSNTTTRQQNLIKRAWGLN